MPAVDLLRVIAAGEEDADAPVPSGLDRATLVSMWRALVLLRVFDERAVALQRQGRIGTYPMFSGEEATQVGPLFACSERDWLFPSYRQSAIAVLRGLPPATILRYRRGHGGSHGFWNPREYRVAPICIPIGTHLPHAVGLAWAAKLRGERIASLVWFGDGATSEGDFHEAMNFAAVFGAPAIFVCVNNRWAISTPFERQTATATIVEKAAAYGMPGIAVDGFDAVACWEATRRALGRARAGEGPTLIEASCYRLGPHGTADDPSRYRDEEETERYRSLEPVGRLAGFLRRAEWLDGEQERGAWTAARAALDEAVATLEAARPPGRDVLFDHVYASGRPWTLHPDVAAFEP
jgi:pyruvate dehydrogenase E1 component alpha subunit